MKTILTIDFDIVMKQHIELHQKLPDCSWQEKIQRFPLLANCSIDYQIYFKITKFLLFLKNKISKDKIFFITDHDEIIPYLDINEEYFIINIDHHHDWAYKNKDIENKIQDLNCGNWVKYIKDNLHLINYLWIGDENSLSLTHPNVSFKLIEEVDLDNLINQIDYLFICLSPSWTPPFLDPMFELWKEICNNY